MFSKTRFSAGLFSLLIFVTGCSRQERPAPERLAIVPLENLTPDADLNWMTRASAGVLGAELAGSPNLQPVEVRSTTDASAAGATAALEGYFQVHNGELRLNGVVRDVATNRTLRSVQAAGRIQAGVLPLLNVVARQLSTSPRPYATANEAAVREYFTAIAAKTPGEMTSHLQAAIQADPRFATPYLAEIEALSGRGDVAGAKAAIARANSAAPSFPPYDRARLQLLEALVNNDLPARAKATAELAKLQPGDVEIRKTLAELYLAEKNYKSAVQALEEASRTAPADAGVWNALGYAYTYAGDLNSALRAFGQYRKLAPDDANAFDSTAEALFYTGNFADAEKNFLAAHQKNAAQFGGIELYRAALCRLVMGDLAKADDLFNKYVDYRKQDPAIPLQTALWKYQTGRSKDALELLQRIAASSAQNDLLSVAHTQLALWYLDSGDRDKARGEAQSAVQTAVSPQTRNLAIAAAVFSLPSADASEWASRVNRMLPATVQERLKQQLLAAALMFDRKYPDAARAWQGLYATSSPAGSLEAPVFLAWCYSQAGNKEEAAKLIRTGIVPPRSPDAGLTPIAVLRYISMRRQL